MGTRTVQKRLSALSLRSWRMKGDWGGGGGIGRKKTGGRGYSAP